MKKYVVSPQNLKDMRDRKGWSQVQLAEKSSLTARRISALENKGSNGTAVHKRTFNSLCKALGVQQEVLSGEALLPSRDKPHEVVIQLHPITKLNLDLLYKMYGLTIDDIINVAPLLLVKVAEASLSRQAQDLKKDIEKDIEKAKEYDQKEKGRRHPSGMGSHDLDHLEVELYESLVDDYFTVRYEALDNRDIFETKLSPVYGYERTNPFAKYLHDECIEYKKIAGNFSGT